MGKEEKNEGWAEIRLKAKTTTTRVYSTASKTGTLRVDGSRHLDSACFFPPIDGVKFVALNFAVSF